MKKSKARQELERIVCETKVVKKNGINYVTINSISCVMQYENTPRNIDVLTIIGFEDMLRKKKIYGEAFNNSVERYKNILRRFEKRDYRIEKHYSFDSHLLRTD